MGKMKDKEFVEERPSRKYGLDEKGYEHLDPRPVEIPTRLRMPGRQIDRMRKLIRRELSAEAERNGVESFDEADDFEMEEVEWVSPYELQFEPDSSKVAVRRNGAAKENESGESRSVGVGGKSEVTEVGSETVVVESGPGGEGAGAPGGQARDVTRGEVRSGGSVGGGKGAKGKDR